MTNGSDAVRQHYGMSGILDRVTAFLLERGIDPERPTYEDFFPFDQLHGGGTQATRAHIERAGIKSSMHVMDLGCGVGGCSRVIAATCGCRVTGIDLTPEFIEVARELTRRCGMADRIEFRQADALDLPFAEATFDHVWCHNVTMNIQRQEKDGLGSQPECSNAAVASPAPSLGRDLAATSSFLCLGQPMHRPAPSLHQQ